jgi:hypothetical protein
MDSPDDFVFLLEEVANRFNPLYEGEYLVIQVRSGNRRLYALHRGFNYQIAKDFAEMENLGSDYNHYTIRIIHNGKLHHVDASGHPTTESREQDWKIDSTYSHYPYLTEDRDCGIEVCECSYPVFWSWRSTNDSQGQPEEIWQAVTCLSQDHGRVVTLCPNCQRPLVEVEDYEEDWNFYFPIPETCVGCKYYAHTYEIVCALHPKGIEGNFCPDYSN